MTSQGLKRPSEFELPNSTQQHQPQQQQQANGILNTSSHSTNNGSGDKRRRLNEFNSIDNNNIINSSSPFKDSSLSTLSQDEITSLIQEEIHQTLSNQSNGNNINNLTANDPPVLTIRQTHAICERIIKDREQKLRDEYDRILACKLALTTTNLAFNLQQQAVAAAAIQQVQQQPRVSAVPNLSTHHHHLNQQQQQLNHHHHHQLINPAAAAAAAAAAANSLINRQNCTNNTNATNLINSSHMLTNNQTIPCGPVLLASNLDEQLAIPENLFTLFGVFGDVIRVKILFNKKDNALIQMADSNQAQVAQGHLDKQKIFGKVIRVARSKHLLVQMPRESNQTDAGLTKDFTNSPLHRFKIPGSRNYLNIYPPSNTLHISNIPANKSESDLQKAFKEACGFDLVSFKFFPKDRKMALMKFNSIEHATIALIKMHNYQIGDNINLKVSFSKSIMQQ